MFGGLFDILKKEAGPALSQGERQHPRRNEQNRTRKLKKNCGGHDHKKKSKASTSRTSNGANANNADVGGCPTAGKRKHNKSEPVSNKKLSIQQGDINRAETRWHDELPSAFTGLIWAKRFLVPSDPQFNSLMRTTYVGFEHQPREWASEKDHKKYLSALRVMETSNLFQYDGKCAAIYHTAKVE